MCHPILSPPLKPSLLPCSRLHDAGAGRGRGLPALLEERRSETRHCRATIEPLERKTKTAERAEGTTRESFWTAPKSLEGKKKKSGALSYPFSATTVDRLTSASAHIQLINCLSYVHDFKLRKCACDINESSQTSGKPSHRF